MRIAATVTSKGQVTIPQAIRQHLGLKRGDRVEFIIQNPGFRIKMSQILFSLPAAHPPMQVVRN